MGRAKHGQYARQSTARKVTAVDHEDRRSFSNEPGIGNPAAVLRGRLAVRARLPIQ